MLSKQNKVRIESFVQKFRVSENPFICLGIITLILFIFISTQSPSSQEGFLCPENDASTNNQSLFFEQNDLMNSESYPPIVISENSFKEATPIAIFEGKTLASLASEDNVEKEIKEYLVEPGENLSQIAQKFGLSLNTILLANDLGTRSVISPGQKLIIPPVDGLIHLVYKGESVSYLAKLYQAESADIIAFNEISEKGEIFAGDLLIIPGGKQPAKPVIAAQAPLATSYFICPISSCRITQRLHWYNAIDFSNGSCGGAVFAAAGGQVQRTGYHAVAGKYVRVLHPNGVVTFYGHLSSILVVPGQQVSQGAVIGYIGNTGYTVGATGCHVHFEVRGAKNPFAY